MASYERQPFRSLARDKRLVVFLFMKFYCLLTLLKLYRLLRQTLFHLVYASTISAFEHINSNLTVKEIKKTEIYDGHWPQVAQAHYDVTLAL